MKRVLAALVLTLGLADGQTMTKEENRGHIVLPNPRLWAWREPEKFAIQLGVFDKKDEKRSMGEAGPKKPYTHSLRRKVRVRDPLNPMCLRLSSRAMEGCRTRQKPFSDWKGGTLAP